MAAEHVVVIEDLVKEYPVRGADDLLGYLQLSVASQPTDLKAHTRRILLAGQSASGERCFGALIDLFIALGQRGAGLKRHLYDKVHAHLNEGQRNYLKHHLTSGIDARDSSPAGYGDSVLSLGFLGRDRRESTPA